MGVLREDVLGQGVGKAENLSWGPPGGSWTNNPHLVGLAWSVYSGPRNVVIRIASRKPREVIHISITNFETVPSLELHAHGL